MKYAREVTELMGAYPGRDFRMKEIVKYVTGKTPASKERHRARVQIARVMRELEAIGCISHDASSLKQGAFALYRWQAQK